MIDGRGIAFVPGITDSHIHPLWGAASTQGADLFAAATLDDLRSSLRVERERVGPNGWVHGWGVHYELFAMTGIRGDLFDKAVGGQPAILDFFDGHTVVANRAALDRAGIHGPVTFAEEAAVVCDNGVPTGELQENAAMQLVRSVVPEADEDTRYGWYRDAFRRFSEVGLTTLHAMDGAPAGWSIPTSEEMVCTPSGPIPSATLKR